MLGLIGSIAGPLLQGLFGVIDQTVEDKDEAARIKAKLQTLVLEGQMKEIETAAAINVAEAQGDSWLQRNWRPLLMCLFGLIIANNYVIAPYMALLDLPSIVLETPPELWALIKLGVGGYVVGRSVEKGVRVWRQQP